MESLIWSVDWAGVFQPRRSLAEMLLRGTIVYFVIVALLRVVHKRQSGMIASTDILVIVLVAEIAGPGLSADSISVVEPVVLIATILWWSFAIERLAYRFPRLERLLDPAPVLLIRDGRMIPRNMRAELVTHAELVTQLRKQGIADIGQVHEARIEADGMISIVRRAGMPRNDGPA